MFINKLIYINNLFMKKDIKFIFFYFKRFKKYNKYRNQLYII